MQHNIVKIMEELIDLPKSGKQCQFCQFRSHNNDIISNTNYNIIEI